MLVQNGLNAAKSNIAKFSMQNHPEFMKKYGHLLSDIPTDIFIKQANEKYRAQAIKRPIVAILDSKFYQETNLNRSYCHNYYKTSHGAIVKAFGDTASNGKVRYVNINITDYDGERPDYDIIESIDDVFKMLKKHKKVKSVNYSIGDSIKTSLLDKIDPKNFTLNDLKTFLEESEFCDYRIKNIPTIVKKLHILPIEELK